MPRVPEILTFTQPPDGEALRSRCLCGLVALCVVVWGLSPSSQAQPPAGPLEMLSALEEATVTAIDSAEHSVVAISRVRRDQAPAATLDPLRLGSPFPLQEPPDSPDFVPTLYGSGVLISQDGFIVTCAHVLDDPRENDYFVWLDKQSYAGRVVATSAKATSAKVYASDPFSDLAVLKIDAENLQPIRFSQKELRKGQFVVALGNPHSIARDGQASASWGIISNLNRIAPNPDGSPTANKETIHQYGTLIQTDAKLNFGTSGGALINLKGEMIGLTTSLAAVSGLEQSAGFAIAVDDTFLRVVESLKLGKLPEYGFLGIQPEELRSVDKARGFHGARVSVVIPGLPGENAGLRADDIIFQINDRKILDRNDLFRELSRAAAGQQLQLRVQRWLPGRTSPEILQVPADLSKKYVASLRPGYAIHNQTAWRGMLVEYATAMPAELNRGGVFRRNLPPVAILSVDPDTPAWEAGLRPGYGILSVAGKAVAKPDDFYSAVAQLSGVVDVEVVRTGERPETISVSSAH